MTAQKWHPGEVLGAAQLLNRKLYAFAILSGPQRNPINSKKA